MRVGEERASLSLAGMVWNGLVKIDLYVLFAMEHTGVGLLLKFKSGLDSVLLCKSLTPFNRISRHALFNCILKYNILLPVFSISDLFKEVQVHKHKYITSRCPY